MIEVTETNEIVNITINETTESVSIEVPQVGLGEDGASTYQIAVENGFVGTEGEWLLSLQGQDGDSAYQVAVNNGFVGTEEEWLLSLQAPGGEVDLTGYATETFVNTAINDAVFSAGTVTPEQVQAVDAKIAYNQDNENFGLKTETTSADWFVDIDRSQLVVETNPYLTDMGVYYGYHMPAGTGVRPGIGYRALFFKKNYGTVLDGKYMQMLFFVKTDDINKFNFAGSQYFCSKANDDIANFTGLTVVASLIETGLYEIRVSGRLPLTGNYTKILIGANISDGTVTQADIIMSGFFSYISDTAMAGTETLTTALPPVYKEILDNTKLTDANKILSDNNGYYRNPKLYGKKWHTLTDSLGTFTTYGYNFLLAEQYGMVLGTYGISGTPLGGTASDAMVNRYSSMTNDADIITVGGGTNDVFTFFTLGVYSDATTSTFYGSLHVLCQGLINKYPNKKIGFITPMQLQGNANALPYVNAIIEVCAEYSIPVLDLYRKGGFSKLSSQQSAIYPDQIHPNAAGFLHYKDKVESFLLTL